MHIYYMYSIYIYTLLIQDNSTNCDILLNIIIICGQI